QATWGESSSNCDALRHVQYDAYYLSGGIACHTKKTQCVKGKHVCFCPCDHLFDAVYRPRARLRTGTPLVVVRLCPPRGDGSAASCRNGCRGGWFGGRAVVHFHLRIGRKRHSRAV